MQSPDSGRSSPATSASSPLGGGPCHGTDHTLLPETCFRIRGIPPDWDKDNLQAALNTILPGLTLSTSQISGPFPACNDDTQTALISLKDPSTLHGPNSEEPFIWIDVDKSERPVHITIDKSFFDLTPLNTPQTPICADVIAVTGLSGHAFGSWRSRNGGAMWLRDFLPKAYPQTRIMTYGYDSRLGNTNPLTMRDHKLGLMECISNARRNCPKRPIIFIAHSLGAMLVIQVLLEWRQSPSNQGLFNCVRGIFLFRAFHNRMNISGLQKLVSPDVGRVETRNMIEDLNEGSQYLADQKDRLKNMWPQLKAKIVSFYETRTTRTVTEVGPGRFAREGEPIQVVQKTSAQCSMPGEVPIPIDSNHSDMVKFSSPEERAFRSVIKYMESLVEKRSRESLKQSLERSIIKQECSFYVDQKEYHHRFLEPSVTAYAEGIFLASNNLDYERWRVDTDPSHTLVYSGFPSLAHALPIFLQDLAKVEKESLILNFSYGSASTSYRYDLTLKGANHKDLCMAWTLFCQATDSYSQDVQQQLFLSFLRVLLAPMNDDELSRVYDDPEEAFTILMGLSSLETILEALEKSLAQVVTIRVSQNNGCSKLKRDIKMILDLDEPSTEHWKELFPKIRTIIRHLRKDGITAKVLIMDPPVIGNLELVPGSEIHVTYDKERQDCLTTLYFHNSRSEKVSTGYAHTFEWLWKTPEYLAWNSTQECGAGLLLIEGKPGSGKSTLMRFFKDRFSPVSSNKIILASFFYHARDGDSERNHTNMLRALLYQILEADESFFACVQPIYRQALRRDELWDLERLKEALRACRRHVLSRSLFLIVDAMDESENTDRTDIIQFFQKLTERTDGSDGKCLVKVFLTSRPINELHPSGLNGVYRIVLQERNKKDIESYTDAFLQNSVFDSVRGAKPALKEYIMEHADGVFLWVHLVAKELVQYAMKGSRQGKLLKFLKSLPKSLEDFYQRMLEGLDSDDPDDLVDGKRILQFCLFSHRAMELHELEHALAMPGLPKDPEPEVASWEIEKPTSIRRLLTQCTGGFVDIQESEKSYAVIQAMHQTVREFFLRPHHRVHSHLNLTSEDDAREMIQLTCVRFLEVLDWELALTGAKDVVEHIGSRQALIEHLNKRPFLKYAIGYLKESTGVGPAIMERLRLILIRNIVGPHMRSMYLLLRPLIIAFEALDICHETWSFVRHQAWDLTYQTKLDSLLQRAAECGLPIAVGNLIAASASVDGDEVSPLNLASKGGHYLTAAVLLDHGASPEQQDQYGNKALHLAVQGSHLAVAQLLLQRGASIQAFNNERQNALHFASQTGNRRIVQLLLDSGIDNSARDRLGRSPLYIAASHGNSVIFQLLLDLGVDTHIYNRDGPTPLHFISLQQGSEAMLLYHNSTPAHERRCIITKPMALLSAFLNETPDLEESRNTRYYTHSGSTVSVDGSCHSYSETWLNQLLSYGVNPRKRKCFYKSSSPDNAENDERPSKLFDDDEFYHLDEYRLDEYRLDDELYDYSGNASSDLGQLSRDFPW